MNRSKSKPAAAKGAETRRLFVPIHQDRYMEGLARGFIPASSGELQATLEVTNEDLKRALGEEAWGSVLLLELRTEGANQERTERLNPLLLLDCVVAWAASEDVAIEVGARLGTFDDVVPGALELKVDPALFPDAVDEDEPVEEGGENLALFEADSTQLTRREPVVPVDEELAERIHADHVQLEKSAGAIAMLRWRLLEAGLPLSQMAGVLADGGESGLEGLTSRAHAQFSGDAGGSMDAAIFSTAAAMLIELTPKQGFDSLDFVRELGRRVHSEVGATSEAEVAAFREIIEKVIDNKIELAESRFDDSGKIGQRALLLFLLAPRAEELRRWISARGKIGAKVSMLASYLSGLYCGMGSLPRQIKGPDPQPFHAAICSGYALAAGLAQDAEVRQEWDESASLHEQLMVGERQLISRTRPPDGAIANALNALRGTKSPVSIDPRSGEVSVAVGGYETSPRATLVIGDSSLRLPSTEVIKLVCRAKPKGRSQASKQLLARLLSGQWLPVVFRLGTATDIELWVECTSADELKDAAALLAGCISELELVTAVKAKRPSTTPPGSKRQAKDPDA